MCAIIQALAEETIEDMGYPSGVTTCFVSGWYVNNIGKLNTLLGTCFSGVSGCIAPDLDNEAQYILKELFLERYYERQASVSVAEAKYNVIQSFQDEDTRISYADRMQPAKYYQGLKKDARANIDRMSLLYRMNQASPRQVIGDDEISEDTDWEL